MATITETFIKPEVFRPMKVATYTIGAIEEAELDQDLQDKINGKADAPHPIEIVSNVITTGTTTALVTAVGATAMYITTNATGSSLTITTNGSETINGDSSIILMDEESLSTVSNGSNWLIV